MAARAKHARSLRFGTLVEVCMLSLNPFSSRANDVIPLLAASVRLLQTTVLDKLFRLIFAEDSDGVRAVRFPVKE